MYYVYIWYIKTTGVVFYVGHGHGNRYKTLKKRTDYFHSFYDNNECLCAIVESDMTVEAARLREIELIKHYRSIGMAKANIHNGGRSGGDVISHMPPDRKKEFIDKMTMINTARARSDDFRRKTGERMRKKYQDPEERQKQSEIVKRAWTDEKRYKQSLNLRDHAKMHPEMIAKRSAKNQKKCVLEFKGKKIEFESMKLLKEYLKSQYGLEFARRTEQDMLKNHRPYKSNRKKMQQFVGLKMYYV